MGLIFVMIAITLLLVGLTAALPRVSQEGQREREEEVIFRGTQYARAVALFHRQFFRYPVNVKELLQTNGMRFLRQEYADPLDPSGKWRFIHVNAAGMLIDSKNHSPGPNMSGPGGTPGGGTGQPDAALQESSPSTGSTDQAGLDASSDSSSTDKQVLGAFIIGVAPTSRAKSIRIWNKRDHYDRWEFLGIDLGLFGVQVGLPDLQTPATGGQPSDQPGSPGVQLPPTPPANPQPPAN